MPPKVLIADNDRAVSALLAEMVRRLDCAVDIAADGEAAVRALGGGGYRALVCDLDMPKVSGFEVVQWNDARPDPAPTLVISGFVDAAVQQRLLSFGCVHTVLKKPFDLMLFCAHVRELLDLPAAGCGEAV